MAEPGVLIDKLPPSSSNPPPPTRVVTSPDLEAQLADPSAVNTVTEVPYDGPTITGFQRLTYNSFILDLVVFGAVGMFFFAQAFRKRAEVHFNAMLGYGVFLFILAFSFFLGKGLFRDFLWGESESYSLFTRGVTWTILAPLLFFMLSRLIHVTKKDKPIYGLMFLIAAGLFLFIALSNIEGLARPAALFLSLGSFTCSAALIIMLFLTLGSLPEDVPAHLRRGVTTIVVTIACGWFLYPFFNLLSQFMENSSLYPLLLNLVDLVTVGLITYGYYQGAGKKSDRIVMKPAFRKAKVAPSTMAVKAVKPVKGEASQPAEADDGVIPFPDQAEAEEPAKPEGPAKPSFRKPAKRIKD